MALRETRANAGQVSLQDGVYAEGITRVLPLYAADAQANDALVLGTWLTGGLRVPVSPLDRIQSLLTWLPPEALVRIVKTAGLSPEGIVPVQAGRTGAEFAGTPPRQGMAEGRFKLPGRAGLENFFNDHVVDVVQNPEHYRALGIGNPPAIILEGPPGCGKTFAVEKLVEFLGWPQFTIEASSIASPYIHETSRKVSQLFRDAIGAAPAVVVIDEVDAFLSERDAGPTSQHRVEEIAEFLRLIPEAIKAGVLIIGMTNRIDVIDPAILRRGRFDHVVKVDFASREEMLDLLLTLLQGVPVSEDIDLQAYATRLVGRPLSDASFIVREGARLAAKARKTQIDAGCVEEALSAMLARDGTRTSARIGFI
ncbi:ATP-binding protein [Salinarimonas soli]|uniref:ATP-binding protein n=2 Tax=Salinarimonas soli TaxID=1638099 RepID=A0A5B2VA62_9HYPH|nr:ATP-binding protein [Salinarimonas soli]